MRRSTADIWLSEGSHDAIVLALAGLRRLGREQGEPLPVSEMTPAPGQGCLAIETRIEDFAVYRHRGKEDTERTDGK